MSGAPEAVTDLTGATGAEQNGIRNGEHHNGTVKSEGQTPLEVLFSTVQEQRDPIEAVIEGEVPSWLKGGTLLLNGPGVYESGGKAFRHLFDPLAIIQRFYFDSGKIFYTSEYLPSGAFAGACREERPQGEFGTKGSAIIPKKNKKDGGVLAGQYSDNAPLSMYRMGSDVFCVSNLSMRAHRISWDTKSIAGTYKPSKPENWKKQSQVVRKASDAETGDNERRLEELSLPLKLKFLCPNPRSDSDGTLYNIAISTEGYCFLRIPEDRKTQPEILARLKRSSTPSYIHSFDMTTSFIIFVESPLRLNRNKARMKRILRKSFLDCLEWKPKHKSKIWLMDKSGTTCFQFVTDPLFVSHHINAYEDKGCVVLEVVAYTDASFLQYSLLSDLRAGNFSQSEPLLLRFVLPLHLEEKAEFGQELVEKAGMRSQAKCTLRADHTLDCTPERIAEQELEFPLINPAFSGRRHRFCFGLDVPHDGSAPWGTKVLKMDMTDGTRWEWRRDSEQQFLSPPIFVQRPGSPDEDDGLLLVPVSNVAEGEASVLVILDSNSLEELGRANVDGRTALAFSGTFFQRDGHFVDEPPVCDTLV